MQNLVNIGYDLKLVMFLVIGLASVVKTKRNVTQTIKNDFFC